MYGRADGMPSSPQLAVQLDQDRESSDWCSDLGTWITTAAFSRLLDLGFLIKAVAWLRTAA
jgi:hypothetical protein